MRLLVLGGTAFLGRALVDAALERGHEVTLFNRGRTNPELFPEAERLRGDRNGLPVRPTHPREWVGLAVAGAVGLAALWLFLDQATSSTVPLADALTTVLSLLATYGNARKLVESWWIWIAADLIYIPLYGYKGLWLTSTLYVGFLCLCIAGLRAWQRDLTRRAQLVPA